MSFWSIILFLIILLVLVIIHEAGHFFVAKILKFRVDEFAFGFPPRLWSKKIGETTYAVNALPIGGYVSIYGESIETAHLRDPEAFNNRAWWAQTLVLVAGVVMNMILALFIYIILDYGNVTVTKSHPLFAARAKDIKVTIVDTIDKSPAALAGLVPGETILNLSSGVATLKPVDAESAVKFVHDHADSVTITYKSLDGKTQDVTLAAVYGLVPEEKVVGIDLETTGTVKTTLGEAIRMGAGDTKDMTKLVWGGLATFATDLVHGKSVLDQISGPVGIAKVVGKASKIGFESVLSLVAILSINLAIFNALPFPALDGGRLIIVLGEAITRRRMPMKLFNYLNTAGFAVLMLILIVVTAKDIFG